MRFCATTLFFFGGSVAVGILNYAFYPILGRLLAPSYFGEVQTLFSLIAHLSVFFAVLGLVVVNLVANRDQQDVTKASATKAIVELEKVALLFSLLLFGLFLLLLVPLKNFFHFGSIGPLLGMGFTILLAVPFTFRRGVLQGHHDFNGISWAGIINALLKIVFAASLVMAGLKTGGAVLALILAQVLTLGYVIWRLHNRQLTYRFDWRRWSRPNFELVRPQLVYAGVAFVVSSIFTLQYSIDLLTVKHYFPAHEAGLYAGISTISNIIFFGTTSVAGVLFASVNVGNPKRNFHLLKRSVQLTLLIGGGALLVFALLPNVIIHLLIGSAYTSYAQYLPREGLALLLVALANLLFLYYMAQRRYAISLIAATGATLTLMLMHLNHDSITAIINNVIIGSLLLLVGICLFGWRKQV